MTQKSSDWIFRLFVLAVLFVAGRAEADPIKVKPIAVTASSSYPGSPPSNVTDGNSSTIWNAGVSASVNQQPWPWIQLDLGRTVSIQKLRLQIAQTPNGTTGHMIDMGQDPINLKNVGGITVNSVDGQWIEFDCNQNLKCGNVRYIRITTTSDPSWVAWKEIEVYQGVEYFGYFGDAVSWIDDDSIPSTTAAGANLVWIAGPTVQHYTDRLKEAVKAGSKGILVVEDWVFDGNHALYPSEVWQSNLRQLLSSAPANSVAAILAADEPYNRGFQKTVFPPLKDWMRINYPTIPVASNHTPNDVELYDSSYFSAFDWVSFDCYGKWTSCGQVAGTTWYGAQHFIDKLRSKLTPGQRMMAFPTAYLPGAATQDDIIDSTNHWQKEILNDGTYIAIAPFRWGTLFAPPIPQAQELLYQFAQTTVHAGNKIFPVGSSASSSYTGTSPFLAFDRNTNDMWNSGGPPAAWIAADLGGSTRVKSITVTTSQNPAGATTHLIEGLSRGTWQPLGTLQLNTQDNQSLGLTGTWDISAIRVTTSKSPSWVAWREISFSR